MDSIEVTAAFTPTPEQLAATFWNMDAEQQANFFAELERIAGVKLCFQMAYVVREIQKRADAGDRRAMDGFQTMLSHAKDYVESATDWRVFEAKSELARMTRGALERIA